MDAVAVGIDRRAGAWRRGVSTPRGLALALAIAVVAGLAATPIRPTSVPWGKADPVLVSEARSVPGSTLSVIVRETAPSTADAESLVRHVGGRVTRDLSLIGSFSAQVPARSLGALVGSRSVLRVWGDARLGASSVDMSQYDGYAPNTVWRDSIKLPQLSNHTDGTGVTVALLDTGVVQSPDLGDRVLARVDFTGERDGWDHFGHGTHMAGIVAGNGASSGGMYAGVAPGANLVSVKVAGADGSTDVSVVIAGMQWIVAHRAEYGIRILNLSFGTDSRQSYAVDPLDYAVEQVWFSGILVVVAAGNRGPDAGTINKPADDPYVVTVGAASLHDSELRSDDQVAPFSSRGPTQDGFVKPDLIAPGISMVSIRAPGSTLDQEHPLARLGEAYFKGTGTSQAAAVVSGVAARLFEQDPSISPDVAKNILTDAAYKAIKSLVGAGNGLADLGKASDTLAGGWKVPANQGLVPSTGLGSIEASRGSLHVYADLPADGLGAADLDGKLDLLTGEIDYLGSSWSATGWSATGWSATGWSATGWSATGWSATGWSATGWSATGWSGTAWSATAWSATGWSATGWSATGWSAQAWS